MIITDGMENASREFSYAQIKSLINRKKCKYGWEFIYLGANIDAVEVAEQFGVARNRAQSFHNDSEGIALNFAVISETVKSFRAGPRQAGIPDGWNADINADYTKRGGKKSRR